MPCVGRLFLDVTQQCVVPMLLIGKENRQEYISLELQNIMITKDSLTEVTGPESERTGKPGVQHFMELQRVGHDLATEQQQPLIVLISIRI